MLAAVRMTISLLKLRIGVAVAASALAGMAAANGPVLAWWQSVGLALAVLGDAAEQAIADAGPDNFGGKVVIDAMNPLDFSAGFPPKLSITGEDSLGERIQRALPDAKVEDIPDDDAIFHDLYDISEKFQIPGEQYVATGRTYEKDGYVPKWRAIRSDRGRIMVAICANMHLGDAWEWADSPEYPEKFSGLAFRIVLNYITYAMTH